MKLGRKISNKITYIKRIDAFFLFVVLVFFLILIAGIFMVSNNYKNDQEELIEDALKIESESLKEKFETFIDGKVDILKGLAKFPAITCMRSDKQRELLNKRAEGLGFVHFFVMDMVGNGYYIDDDITKDQSKEPFFENVSSHHVYITEPFYAQDVTFMTVCVSIFDVKDVKIGSLCGTVNLSSLRSVLNESDTLLDGEIFMVNREGLYISAKDMQKVHNKQIIFSEEESEYELLEKAFAEKNDQVGIVIINGEEYKAQITYLENYDWAIVQCIAMESVFEGMKYIDLVKYGALVIVVVLIGCVARIALHWRTSQKRVNTDALTGCNSRAATEVMVETTDKITNRHITLIYLDLNKFKMVNDTYGHDVGDRILCIFSKSLVKVFGKYGFVGRMGGDEFMVILTGIREESALKLCHKLEEVLVEESKKLDFEYTISTSYGIATRLAGESTTMEQLMVVADENMYKFKEAHR